MSYGTYDNQGPLNQPFNPTANNSLGGGILTNLLKKSGGMVIDQLLPGAQDPNNQQYFQQMRQNIDGMNEALQKIEQGPQGQFGGGKGGGGSMPGGKSAVMPSSPRYDVMPDFNNITTGPF